MEYLATLGLTYDEEVVAKVLAYNTEGWSLDSSVSSSGALLNTVP
jgi:hypothetical protein